jgi:hypothetical protein
MTRFSSFPRRPRFRRSRANRDFALVSADAEIRRRSNGERAAKPAKKESLGPGVRRDDGIMLVSFER